MSLYLAGNWSEKFGETLESSRAAVLAINSTRVDLLLTEGLSSWISSVFFLLQRMGGSGSVWRSPVFWVSVHAMVGLQTQISTKMWQGRNHSSTCGHRARGLPWNLVIYSQELVGIWVLCFCIPRICGSIALGWERLNDHWSAPGHRWGFLLHVLGWSWFPY